MQIVGCLLFAAFVGLLYVPGLFSPVSAIILYVIMGLGNVINARTMLMKPIEDLSKQDKLTGCFNRLMLESKTKEYEKYNDYAVIFFDVNNLKRINDIHGHHDGDKILRKASEQLGFWRKYGDLYRTGGDEFIVVAPNMTSEKLEPVVSGWYRDLPPLNEGSDDDFICNLSYGIYYGERSSAVSFNEILKTADEKMYEMKKVIKGQTC